MPVLLEMTYMFQMWAGRLEFISVMDEAMRADMTVNDPANPGRAYICGKGIPTPDDPGDDAVVGRFVEAYLSAHAGEGERGRELAMHDALTPADRDRLSARYAKAVEGTARFLRAEDLPEEQRQRHPDPPDTQKIDHQPRPLQLEGVTEGIERLCRQHDGLVAAAGAHGVDGLHLLEYLFGLPQFALA